MVQKETDIQKYSFYRYSPKYKKLYQREYVKIKKLLPYTKIEHIGSSSVKNLGGKGIIDIVILTDNKRKKRTKEIIERAGYEYMHHKNDKSRMFFYKKIKYAGKVRRVHLHLTLSNEAVWKGMIAVRNLLRDDKKIAKEYADVKKRAVKYAKGDGKKYMKYKDSYLKKLEKRAIRKYFKE